MKDVDSMEKHVERKLLIAQLAQRFFNESPGSKDVIIWEFQITDFDPLLKDKNTFLIAMERVVEELVPGFEVITTEYFHDDGLISITMDDPKRLYKYIAEKEVELAEIKRKTSRHAFVLDAEAKLYLANSKLPPYPIERGSLRHKLIYYLAKHEGYMSAAQLAKKIGSSPVKVRKTVGQIRDQIIDRFNVPGADLIYSRDTGSYRADTVTVRVPKGYTP
ncbi:MAG: hypothetical protein WCV80_02335 [Candidatus Paceibacterota bacterium]